MRKVLPGGTDLIEELRAKDIKALIAISFIIAPVLCLLLSALCAVVLMFAEEWEFLTAFWYVTANISGMPNPFVNASPATTRGQIIDLWVSCNAMVFSSTVAGMAGMLTFVSNLPDALKTLRLHSLSKGISTLTVAIPFLIAVSSAFLGGLLALSEGWSYWEGFRFVFGAACGLGTPLTNVNPVTFRGRLISVVIGVAYEGLVGVIVGLAGSIGIIESGIRSLEGALKGNAKKTAAITNQDDPERQEGPQETLKHPAEEVNVELAQLAPSKSLAAELLLAQHREVPQENTKEGEEVPSVRTSVDLDDDALTQALVQAATGGNDGKSVSKVQSIAQLPPARLTNSGGGSALSAGRGRPSASPRRIPNGGASSVQRAEGRGNTRTESGLAPARDDQGARHRGSPRGGRTFDASL